MSLSITPQQANAEAGQILVKVSQAAQYLEHNAPAEFLQQADRLLQDGATGIATLQRRLQTLQGATDADRVTITQTLSSITEIMNRIQRNRGIATDIILLGSEIEQLLAPGDSLQIDAGAARSLGNRITALSNQNPTQGSQQMLQMLSQLLGAAHQTGSGTTSSTLPATRPTIHEIRAERAAQDAEHQAAELAVDLQTLKLSLTNIPADNFQRILVFYRRIKHLPQRMHADARQQIQEMVQRIERDLVTIIEGQAERERLTLEAFQNQQAATSSLQALRAAINAVIAAGPTPPAQGLIAAVQAAYAALDFEDKPALLAALNALLMQQNTITRPLQCTVLGQPIATWHGTWEQKLAALTTLLPPQAEPAPVAAIAATMRQQFEAAQRAAPAAECRPAPAAAPAPVRSGQPSRHAPVEMPVGNAFASPVTRSLGELQEVLPFLQEDSSPAALQQALFQLTLIESRGETAAFRITAGQAAPVIDRIHFHLYLIHRDERGQLPPDMRYGSNAMAGVYPTTNTERQRAILRTIAELALENLDIAINFMDGPGIVAMLELLERLRMDRRDLPEGQHNIAHNLFGQMYHLHVAARQTTPSLIDPHDARFQGDFGRMGFLATDAGIDPAVKLRAVDAMLQALKAAWRI